MKKLNVAGLWMVAIGLLLVACDKDPSLTEAYQADLSDVMELAYLQDLTMDIEQQADEATLAPPPPSTAMTLRDCATISAENEKGIFPNTITIDFGEGCTGPKGRVHAGKIIIVLSDSLHHQGATRSVTFEEYTVDGAAVQGSKNWENLGIDEDGIITIHKTVDLSIEFPDGTTAAWAADHQVSKSTQFVRYRHAGQWKKRIVRFKGTVSVEGNSSGTNRQGDSFSAEIIEPLTKKENCFWITSGVKEVTKNGETRSIDFGDGRCNNAAMVTLPDGSSHEINLRPFWKR